MNENYEDHDWDDDNLFVPIIKSAVQLKKLEERRLQEESDYLVAKDLFSNEEKNITLGAPQKHITKIQITEKKVFIKRNNISNNEAKQKETSQKIKETKEKKTKEIETYGENEYCDEYEEYLDYEDKF